VINIGKLRAASASYYLSAVASDQVGYYVGNGEAPGRWCGSLAAELDLEGAVDATGFERLLAGLHPATGEELLSAAGSNSRARARSDDHRARRTEGASALDTAQVAAQLGVTDRAVQQWLKAGADLASDLATVVGRPITTGDEVIAALEEVGPDPDITVPSTFLVGSRQPRPASVGRGGPRWVVTQDEVDRLAAARRPPTAQAGWDVVFRPPKSYSVLWAVGGDDLGNDIKAIHHEAVEDALAYLEDAAATARTTADVAGSRQRVRVETTGFVAAAFDHRDSRAGDPLLHTHVVIANATRRPDGSWAALDPRGVYAQARAADGVYQATFRHLAERRLGIASDPVVNGWADAQGVPRSVVEHFSKRSADIEAELARIGAHSASARQAAALATRQAKQPKDGVDLHGRWRAEAQAIGFGPAEVAGCIGRTTGTSIDRRTIEIVFANLGGPSGLTATSATFTRADVVAALATSFGGAVRGSALTALADEFCASDRVLHVSESRPGHRRARILNLRGEWTTHLPDTAYTTPELALIESDLMAWAATTSPLAPLDATTVEAVLAERPALNEEQRHMVRVVCGSSDFVRPVVGYPGSGKTYASEAVVAALAESGTPVVGCAVTAEAADELAQQTGLGSRPGTLGCDTIARLLGDLDEPEYGGLPSGAVVIVDEASTVPHRDLHRLATHVRQAGGSMVLVGDPHQHGAVGPGSFFAWVATERPVVTLVSNNRQRDALEQLANVEYREGRIAESLSRRDRAGRITRAATADELYGRVVDEWFDDWRRGARDPMIATRNAVRDELAARARTRLAEADALHGPTVELAGTPFQVGDTIVTRRNNRRLRDAGWFVKNGSRGTVVEIDHESGDLLVDFAGHEATPHRVRLPYAWAASSTGGTAHVEYGYAVTDFGVQGRTLDVARAVLDDATTAAGAYVASTRGRDANRLYVVEGHQADRGVDGDVVHDVEANAAERDLDAIARRLASDEPDPLIHEIDPRSTEVGQLAATSTLLDLERRLAGVERRLADAPADVSRRIAGAERRRDELVARRRVVNEELRSDRTPDDGLRHRGELHELDGQIGALAGRLVALRAADRERLEYREQYAHVFERRDLLRSAIEARTTQLRLAAPVTVGRLLPSTSAGTARSDRWAVRAAAEELAVWADRNGRRTEEARSVTELLGTPPVDRGAAEGWARAAAAVQRVDPALVESVPFVERELTP
jgi:conjugative relaxase-like TrwC/TraI family protein